MELKNIKIKKDSFMGENTIVKDSSVSFKSRLNIIYGRPGSGKTTLLETLAGLNKIETGEISYDGKIFFLMQVPERGFVYTQCKSEITGGTNLSDHDRQNINKLGLDENMMYISPWNLSRGEKKKLSAASILNKVAETAKEDRLILLDDPFRDLDKNGKKIFLDLFFNNKNFDKIIMATAVKSDLVFLDRYDISYSSYDIKKRKIVG